MEFFPFSLRTIYYISPRETLFTFNQPLNYYNYNAAYFTYNTGTLCSSFKKDSFMELCFMETFGDSYHWKNNLKTELK